MRSGFTGERVVPGLVDLNLLNEHLSRYEFAKRFAAGKRVLDAGCGSGYGAAELAKIAAHVTGIDAAEEAVGYAREHYSAGNLHFAQGLCTALPDGPFDLITAFEVIEHLEDWRGFLAEARRVLAPGGLFLVSTPNRLYYAESRGASGANPFHVHEFEYAEFLDELTQVFARVAMFTQNHAEGVLFTPVDEVGRTEASVSGQPVPEEAHFFVALCGLEPLPPSTAFIRVPSAANLLRERERHIELQAGEIRMKTEWLAERKAELDQRNLEYADLLAKVRELNAELTQRNEWALASHAEAERRGRLVLEKQEELARETAAFQEIATAYESQVAELENTNRARAAWALETERRLGAEIAESRRDLAACVDVLHSVEQTLDERTAWARGLDSRVLELERDLSAWQQRYDTLRGSRWVRAGNKLKLVDPR